MADSSVRRPSVNDNGELPPGDSHEPADAADTSFDPAALERQTGGGPDPFDPASLRLAPSLNTAAGVKKALLTLPVRKPDKSWWVRTHPDPRFRLQGAAIEVRGEGNRGGELYLVAGHLHTELQTDPSFRACYLALAVNRQGDPFLWHVNLPREGDRVSDWSRSALDAIERATKRWVRVAANMGVGAYDLWEATAAIPEPAWPEMAFPQLLRVAFKDRLIDTLDHTVLRQLRGEA